MTEKEKMLAGLIYNAAEDKELEQERFYIKDLCFEFNNTKPSDREKQKELIKKMFGKTGENFVIEAPLYCDYGYNIEIGENFFANHDTTILDCAKVKFGDNVFIGPNCGFYTPNHPLDVETRNKGLETSLPIVVEDNVWIGGGVRVLQGVTIGEGSVIAAGSVVTKNIPKNVLAGGIPCKVIKKINKSEDN